MEVYHPVDENGDVDVIVGDHRIRVSSMKMAALSTKFKELFRCSDQDGLRISEDATTFLRICQSAHGIFIPQADITIHGLVELAIAIEKYQVRDNTQVHALATFSFILHTLKPGLLSSENTIQLLRVAKVLSVEKFRQLLFDTFFHHCASRMPSDSEDHYQTLIFARLIMKIRETQDKIACCLMCFYDSAVPGNNFSGFDVSHPKRLFDTGIWVLETRPSLRQVQSELKSIQNMLDPTYYDASIERTVQACRDIILQAECEFTEFVWNLSTQDDTQRDVEYQQLELHSVLDKQPASPVSAASFGDFSRSYSPLEFDNFDENIDHDYVSCLPARNSV